MQSADGSSIVGEIEWLINLSLPSFVASVATISGTITTSSSDQSKSFALA